MKSFILASIILITVTSCDEESYIIPDVYSGYYRFESEELTFDFNLVREYGVHKGVDARVSHESITGLEGRNSLVAIHNPTGSGCQQLRIRSDNTLTWRVDLMDVVFTEEGMKVSEIRYLMPGQEERVLPAQFLSRFVY